MTRIDQQQKAHLRERITSERQRRLNALLAKEPQRITLMRAEIADFERERDHNNEAAENEIYAKARELAENIFFGDAQTALAAVKEWEGNK